MPQDEIRKGGPFQSGQRLGFLHMALHHGGLFRFDNGILLAVQIADQLWLVALIGLGDIRKGRIDY